MTLGRLAIKAAIASGAILCDPAPATIEETHIDVRIGKHYWLSRPDAELPDRIDIGETDPHDLFFEREAKPTHYIVIPPGRFALLHTHEFIGTTVPDLLPTIDTRSTVARYGVALHEAAGFGDVGFHSRWTLEVWNRWPRTIRIPVGGFAGLISFQRVEDADTTTYTGRYNVSRADWTPEAMLPRRGNL